MPTEAFAQLGRIRLVETELSEVFHQVADLAKRTIPGASEVSVTLVRNQDAHTTAFTGDLALILDETQYELGHGPCLVAAVSTSIQHVVDMNRDNRWPDWAARAREAGAHSSLSIGLPMQDAVTGALNIYATKPHAFDEDALAVAETFASYAEVAMANAYLYDAQTTLAQHREIAMRSRAVIEQAKGIIMGDRRCSADEAFTILTNLSQHSNRKLRDVAATLIERVTTPKP
ncbi:GAF and ANTAR domain-containing protein [Actinoplanes xinjiangensis]|uniref:GAF and ANTAR domain-containing protein n=1 Tax=Actinoplanes xinjiangensis TaxID=512350 RepID=UPI0034451610